MNVINVGNHLFTSFMSPMAILILLLVLILLMFKSYRIDNRRKHRSLTLPPFVKSGVLETLKRFTSPDSPSELLRWAQESGPVFRLRLANLVVIVSNDLSLTQTVLNDRNSYKPKTIYRGFVGDTMFNCEGFRWRHVRKSVAPAFSAHHIQRMTQVSNEKIVDFMTKKLDHWVDEKCSFDLCTEMLTLTFTIICDAAFEYEISQEEMFTFLHDVKTVFVEGKYRSIPFRWKLGKFIKGVKKAEESARSLRAFGMKILTSFRNKKSTTKGTVIDCIANDDEYLSDEERVKDIVVFLIAGHDTTAFSLAWTLLELAKHPHEQEALRSELEKLPVDERSSSPFLKNVIREGMRLHPVASMGSVRNIAKDLTMKLDDNSERSFHIPKNSTVFCPLILLMRNPRYYDDPDRFMPSRWVNPSPEALAAFIPFSVGKRNCIGQALAIAELHTVISELICKYNFTVTDIGTREYFVTLKPTGARLTASRIL